MTARSWITAGRVLGALSLALASCSRPAAPAAPVPAPRPVPAVSAAPAVSLDELDELLGGGPASPAADPPRTDVAGYRQWVRDKLRAPATYSVLASVLSPTSAGGPDIAVDARLKEGRSATRGTYYYRFAPCPERDLERVHPWWSPSSEVWVCRDDHRPEVLVGASGRSCDVTRYSLPETEGCGCGPYLMFCATDGMAQALIEAGRAEIRDTIADIVRSDRPFGELLTRNDTVRSGLAELWHARVDFFLTGRFTPPDITGPPMLRPRPAIFQGGILSTPTYLFQEAQRTMVDAMVGDFLCVPLRSEGVATHVLLDALRDQSSLRSQSHLALASTVGCQNCHARLEYGIAALAGWQSTLFGTHYVSPPPGAPTTRFYLHDHRDLRGEGPPNLGWLGATIVRQPEFAQCMVKKVTSFVYEGARAPYAVERALLDRFARDQRMAQLIEDAVVARAFGPDAVRGPGSAR